MRLRVRRGVLGLTYVVPPPVRPSNRCSPSSLMRSRRATFYTSPSGTASARLSFAAVAELFIQSRDLRPLDRYFPELHDALLASCRPHVSSTARSSSPPERSRFRRAAACACTRRRRESPNSRRKSRPRSSLSICSRSVTRSAVAARTASDGRSSNGRSQGPRAPRASDAGHPRSLARRRLAGALRRRGPRRRHREARRRRRTSRASAR